MKLVKSLFYKNEIKKKYVNVITGGQLNFTQDVISRFVEINRNNETNSLIIINNTANNKDIDYDLIKAKYINIFNTKLLDNEYKHKYKILILNKDFFNNTSKTKNINNNNNNNNVVDYLKTNNLVVKSIFHLDHIEILTDYSDINCNENDYINYSEFERIIETYISYPMYLNSLIINNSLSNSKDKDTILLNIFHLLLQKPFNIPSIFKPNLLFNNQLSNMQFIHKSQSKLKILIGLLNLKTIDKTYIDFIKDYISNDNNEIREKINLYYNNYNEAVDLCCYLMSNPCETNVIFNSFSKNIESKLIDLDSFKNFKNKI